MNGNVGTYQKFGPAPESKKESNWSDGKYGRIAAEDKK